MSKIIKKVLVAFVFAICAIALVGCQMGGGSGNDGGKDNGGNQTGATVAKIPANLQGTYKGDDVVVVVYESKVTITDPSGKTLEYTIYTEDGKYYVEEDGNKNYCTFGDGTVTNSHGTFSKNGSQGNNPGGDNPGGDNPGGETNTSDILAKLRRLSGISDLRLPEGGTVRAEDINETGLVGYGVLISGASEAFATYKTYFDAKVKAAGFEETLEGFTKLLEDGSILGIALSQDKDGSIQIAVIQASEVVTDEIPVATFQAQFKEATGIDIVFPSYVTGVVVPVFEIKNQVMANINFEAEGVSNATEAALLTIANIIGPNFEAEGLVKGEVTSNTYNGVVEFSVNYSTADYQSQLSISLSSYNGYTACTVFYSGPVPQGAPEWPAEAIAKIFGTNATVPVFEGQLGGVTAIEVQGKLSVLLSGIAEKDATLWLEKLVRAGFTKQGESDLYVNKYGEYDAAVVEAGYESGYLSLKFYLQEMTSSPWPSSEITAKFSAAVEAALPKLDGTNRSFEAREYNDSLIIYVTGNVSQQTVSDYYALLTKAGFVLSSYEYVYTFDNYDTLRVDASLGATGGVDAIIINVYYEEYKPIQYVLPDNFEAQILGFKLVKIGESYVYMYDYSGSSTMVEEYLYDASTKTWTHAAAQVYPFALEGKTINWKSFDQNDANAISQVVNRPQIDDFLRGTNALAYSFYESYLEALESDPANVIKDASKNETIAGVACEYVKWTNNSLTAAGLISTFELWIDPVTHMIFKVTSSLSYNGQEQTNTPFEIKSLNKNVTSFADAGISNCVLISFNGATLADTDHLWGTAITNQATCGTAGETYKVCECCHEKKVLESIPATGEHTPYMNGQEIMIVGDYEGHHSKYCTECKQYYDQEDCTYGNWVVDRAATCKSDGLRHHDCTVCHVSARETIPANPNAHMFLREYHNDATVVVPTKETAGSITWSCIEDCGATYTITLPILNDTNYSKVVFQDFDDNNYEFFVLDIAKLIKEMNDNMNPSFTIDSYYIQQYVFSWDNLAYNYDDNNPLYGFKGDIVADEVASVPKAIQGEYYNEDNLKAVIGESVVTIYAEQTASYTLYSKDGAIYFEVNGSKVYVTVNEDGTIEAGDFGLFAKRVAANIPSALRGVYVSEDEEDNTYIEVSASTVKVITGEDDPTYELYVDGDDYFFVMNNEKVYVNVEDEIVTVDDIGVFVRPGQGDEGEGEGEDDGEDDGDELEDTELWPTASIADFLGFEDFYTFGYEGAEYTWEASEEYGIIYVALTLPEDVDVDEVVASFISEVEGYDPEDQYVVLDGYYLAIQAYEGKVYVQYGIPQ